MPNFWTKLPKPIIALAPMAGYTDSAFRLLCRNFGADVVYSEMISVDAICFNNQKTLEMLKYSQKEYPLVFQLFGNDPKKFAQATKIISKKVKGDIGIDINFGCPAHKVTRTGSGASLMNVKEKAYEIIKAVCDSTTLPVSIKIRTKVKNTTAEKFIKKVKNLPWTTVMIHGRTFNQGFSGPIDYRIIKKIKKLVPHKIVLANGGIINSQTAQEVLKQTNADGLGIARGSLGNPWIFEKIKKELTLDKTKISVTDRKKIILRHAKLFLKKNDNLIPLRKHLIHYVKAQKNASNLRQKIIRVETLENLKKILN